jgi:hypothetical protein
MSVRRLLEEVDSQELSEWAAYDALWPLPDPWQQTARLCRIVMCASGNYKKVPDEEVFIPSKKKPMQTNESMISELMKLAAPPQG